MLSQVPDGRFDQVLTGIRIGHKFGESLRSFVPSADGQKSLQVLVVSLEPVEFGVSTLIDVLPFVEGFEHKLVGESAKGVDEMSAQVRVDVLRQELGQSRTIRRPICVVAHDPPGTSPTGV